MANMEGSHQSDIDRLRDQCNLAMNEIETLHQTHAERARDLEFLRQQNHSK